LDEVYNVFRQRRSTLGSASGEDFSKSAPASRAFWISIGFTYSTIDFDGHRESTAINLNQDRVPEKLFGQFDLVVNTGTTEHVANQDNAFRVIHDLTRLGGVMYHEVPAGSWNHGLINYSPKFFLLLHKQNDYEQLLMRERTEADMTIRAALRKRVDREFATPLDVPSELMPRKYKQPWRTIRRIAKLP
jgi:SAM-dependent methyltransferase